jgi:hypothetical protein
MKVFHRRVSFFYLQKVFEQPLHPYTIHSTAPALKRANAPTRRSLSAWIAVIIMGHSLELFLVPFGSDAILLILGLSALWPIEFTLPTSTLSPLFTKTASEPYGSTLSPLFTKTASEPYGVWWGVESNLSAKIRRYLSTDLEMLTRQTFHH